MKKKLTKTQKRLLVLKDALKQIKVGFMKPSTGAVCRLPNFDADDPSAKKVLKKLIDNNKRCEVCARGALLLSSVIRFNEFTAHELNIATMDGSYEDGSVTDNKLTEIFSTNQIAQMERAFEGCHNGFMLTIDDAILCDRFFEKHKNDKERLIAILENAIEHKGIFKP